MAIERQIRYWKASAPSASRAVIAPKLHTAPDASASSEATSGMCWWSDDPWLHDGSRRSFISLRRRRISAEMAGTTSWRSPITA